MSNVLVACKELLSFFKKKEEIENENSNFTGKSEQ